jgi:hypothetical protein
MVVMFRFNHNGNGDLVIDITNAFRISKGIVDFTPILSLETMVVCWPIHLES